MNHQHHMNHQHQTQSVARARGGGGVRDISLAIALVRGMGLGGISGAFGGPVQFCRGFGSRDFILAIAPCMRGGLCPPVCVSLPCC